MLDYGSWFRIHDEVLNSMTELFVIINCFTITERNKDQYQGLFYKVKACVGFFRKSDKKVQKNVKKGAKYLEM